MTAALWDEVTAHYYDEFTRLHRRYQHANAALVAHASLFEGARVLDLAAGSGLTAEAALPIIGRGGSIVCVEPSRAMRELGRRRVTDSRVRWEAGRPAGEVFDRALCGAAIWQMDRPEIFRAVYDVLRGDGAFAFDIPSVYLGVGDEPGGGADPLLLQLPALVPHEAAPASLTQPVTIDAVENELRQAGFARLDRWSFRLRLTQATLRDWLKLPIINRAWMPARPPEERAAIIDRLFESTDPDSWRWEGWTGWTASKAN